MGPLGPRRKILKNKDWEYLEVQDTVGNWLVM